VQITGDAITDATQATDDNMLPNGVLHHRLLPFLTALTPHQKDTEYGDNPETKEGDEGQSYQGNDNREDIQPIVSGHIGKGQLKKGHIHHGEQGFDKADFALPLAVRLPEEMSEGEKYEQHQAGHPPGKEMDKDVNVSFEIGPP
jgi:hypothetical protein